MTARVARAAGRAGNRAGSEQTPARRLTLLTACATLITTWGTAAALACVAPLQTPSHFPELGKNCSRIYRATVKSSVLLGEVRDFGGGVIAQPLKQENGCSSEGWYVVQDCKTGQGLMIGPELMTWAMRPRRSRLGILERELSASRTDVTLETVAAAARGFEKRTALVKGAALKFGEVTMPLDCGCKTAYPALKPRG